MELTFTCWQLTKFVILSDQALKLLKLYIYFHRGQRWYVVGSGGWDQRANKIVLFFLNILLSLLLALRSAALIFTVSLDFRECIKGTTQGYVSVT
jgi:hypothetical protein